MKTKNIIKQSFKVFGCLILAIFFALSQVRLFSASEAHIINVSANIQESWIRLNEFLPNPLGSDGAERPNGEWVELYNLSPDSVVDLTDWVLEDEAGHQLVVKPCNTDTEQTTISPLGFLVVYRNAGQDCKSNFSLNNDDDTIILYNNAGHKIDSHNYIDAKAEGFSHARIPDGSGPWVDPIPTPGAPNRLESEFLKGPENNPSENDYPEEKEEPESKFEEEPAEAAEILDELDSQEPAIEETFPEELNLQTDSDEISDEEEIETEENLSEQIIEETDQKMTEEIDEEIDEAGLEENKNQEETRTEILEEDETALAKEEKTDIIEETTEQADEKVN